MELKQRYARGCSHSPTLVASGMDSGHVSGSCTCYSCDSDVNPDQATLPAMQCRDLSICQATILASLMSPKYFII